MPTEVRTTGMTSSRAVYFVAHAAADTRIIFHNLLGALAFRYVEPDVWVYEGTTTGTATRQSRTVGSTADDLDMAMWLQFHVVTIVIPDDIIKKLEDYDA